MSGKVYQLGKIIYLVAETLNSNFAKVVIKNLEHDKLILYVSPVRHPVDQTFKKPQNLSSIICIKEVFAKRNFFCFKSAILGALDVRAFSITS